MENERITVMPAVAWVLADHFSRDEMDKMNEIIARRDYDELSRFVISAERRRPRGISTTDLYYHLVDQFMPTEDEEDEGEEE